VRQWPKISIYAPAGKTMRWIEKWLTPFRIVRTFSISMQSLGLIELRAPVVRAKIGVFFVCHAWSACAWGTQFKQVLCDGLWVDFDAVFNTFFRKYCSFRCATYFSFSSLDGATFFAKLQPKIAKSPKIGGKVCPHRPLRIDSWRISKKFYCSSLGGICRCAPI